MTKCQLPSPETLRQLLRYEPETGKLFWLPRERSWFTSDRSCNSWNARDAETEAFTATMNCGYKQGIVIGKQHLAHRVAWAIYYGIWPENEIDHINNIRSDNRISNLRDATRSQNQHNRYKTYKNKSGYKGVHWHRSVGMWRAKISKEGKDYILGYFTNKEDASKAYIQAAKRLHLNFAKY